MYDPNPVSESPEDLRRYLNDELQRIRDEFNSIHEDYDVSDFFLRVSSGKVAGHSTVNKFGRNSAIGSGATEVIWDGSTATYPFPATADITHLA